MYGLSELTDDAERIREIIRRQSFEEGFFADNATRVNGKLHWLHVAASSASVYYTVHAKRGQEAMDAAGLLPAFKGCAVHDHWKPYWHYGGTHALCNAHHLRELRYCEEATGHFWPAALRRRSCRSPQPPCSFPTRLRRRCPFPA